MGINGLLPFLEKASKPINIKEYSGCTVAVDTYCWLHKGAFSCAEKLARGEQTDQYVMYCMKFINMLLSYNIKPILVFDGRHLPAKAETEKVRKERRDMNRKKAAEMLRADRVEEARSLIRRCIDVTHEMASALMDRCRSTLGVDCIVAPYEADAQLAFFSVSGAAHLVITEDSDLLLFGCKKVLFKMDVYGNGLLVDQGLIHLAMKVPSDKFSMDKFIYMCILSGCDYLPSLPGIGLAKACKFIKRTADDDICRALSRLGSYLNMNNLVVSQEYKDKFIVAESMFKYQPIYDPFHRRLTSLNPLPNGIPLPIDERLSDETCYQLALGNLNPFTLVKTNDWDPDDPKNFKTSGWSAGTVKNSIWSKDYQPKQVAPKKMIATFDKYVSRMEKTKDQAARKHSIEASPPKKRNLEEELNNLRKVYGIGTASTKNINGLGIDEIVTLDDGKVDEKQQIDETYVDLDDLFGDDTSRNHRSETLRSNVKNPFSKSSTVNKTNQLTPLFGALSKMSKLSTPVSGTSGEVSRYFSSSYSEKEVTPTKLDETTKPKTNTPPNNDNTLKDIINTPTKPKSHESCDVNNPTTPNSARRNIFSSQSSREIIQEPMETPKIKTSPGRPSFLAMLDTMVSPKEDRSQNKASKLGIDLSAPKKQAKLSFSESSSSTLSSNIKGDVADRENSAPVEVTAIVKALPASLGSLEKKMVPKTLISHKLGPAKTIGLKRKKSSSIDNGKACQKSISDMFAFQPKAKLKMQ